MEKNKSIYLFLEENAKKISDEWYETIEDDDSHGVYTSTNPVVIETLKKQNLEFNYLLNHIFNGEEDVYYCEIKKWAVSIAEDPEHQNTPIYKVIREFMRVRNLYLIYIKQFSLDKQDKEPLKLLEEWRVAVTQAVDFAINLFVEKSYHVSQRKIQSQKEMIYELSSPVILLYKGAALLPLIGDIDTDRAKIIMDSTLFQCTEKNVSHLFLDLSGVLIIDTMVAQQLSHLMTALKLIGVETTISGIRPEIAQTSVQLGISFSEGSIKSTLAQAISDTIPAL
ncbi:STAS domain-containing protein [Jeotgalibacillus proteolyticus]|uniref:RsbT co-antagonist protein RsbRB n=1 Tax=Jeotgalibacillus proteolyticus TaxID=2082395 RepID=A0A2S5GCE4_9BACL|nr:STAS domain-containing protein [Jeotgalibacillus proteolyticus]PPA70702.1 RsbT co-antagonist protein RsbRB [Jeotgalibacillus proteolyticus]